MRIAAICSFLAAVVALVGCGGGDSAPVTASASGGAGAPPPPPGGGPPSPGAPDGAAPPADGTAPMSDAPPGGTPDGGTPGGNPEGYVPPTTGTPDGAPPGEGNPGVDGVAGDPSAPRPPRPKTFQDLLEDALVAGNEQEWLQLINLNYIANPNSWTAGLQKDMAWIPGLRRPALGTRFGIAVLYANAASLPRDFDGSPQPIGSSELTAAIAGFEQAANERKSSSSTSGGEEGNRRRRGKQGEGAPPVQGEAGTDAGKKGEGARGQLDHFAGDFGTKFLEALKARIESGEYGAIYKGAAEALAHGGQRRRDPNNPDSAGTSDGAPGIGAPEGGEGVAKERGAADSDRLGLAVVWLGKTDSRDELDQLAQKSGVDLLVTYELTLQPAKNNSFVNNKTRLKITPVKGAAKKDEVVFSSAVLENRLVMQARKEKKEDPVEKEVAKAIEALDAKCKMAAFPAGVSAEAIKRRVAALIAEKPADPLPTLVEVRYYTAKGLLAEEEMTAAAAALVGPTEYVRMIASAPGGGIGQQIGASLGLPSVLNVLHGLNAATSGNLGELAAVPRVAPPAEGGKAMPAGGGGMSGKGKGGKGKRRPPGSPPPGG